MTPKFKYVLSLLENGVYPPPKEHAAEIEAVKKILTEGQGYLTKNKPIKIIFFKNLLRAENYDPLS